MKKLILFILPFTLCAESNYTSYREEIVSIQDPIIEMLSEIRLGDSDKAWEMCHEQYTSNSNLIRQEFLLPYLKLKAQKIANEMVIMQKKHEMEKAELEAELKLQKIKLKFQEREALIAESFNSSHTCKINGVSWFDLTADQKAHYRETYVKYHSQYTQK